MSLLEKLFGHKSKPPQEIEKDLEKQITELKRAIETKETTSSDNPNIRNIELEKMKKKLADLEAKKNLAWEIIRNEGEKIGELTK